jgi:microcystin-dependent protein
MCDGTAVSRTTYSALYAIVGTTFGAGDGTTTFNLPNYTNRIPYGTTIGATGGTADAVVVSHTHAATVTDTGHFHAEFNTDSPGSGSQVTSSNYSTVNSGNGYYAYTILGTSTAPTLGLTSTNTTGVTVSNASAGTSGTNQNLPPYLGINFIIKI